jgi:hypothetical protein
MTHTIMPKDANNNVIPAVRLKNDCAHIIAATSESAVNEIAFDEDTRIISLYATEPVYVRFGTEDAEADATDHYFPAGVYYNFSIGGGDTPQFTHVAVLAVSSNGTVYISEKY